MAKQGQSAQGVRPLARRRPWRGARRPRRRRPRGPPVVGGYSQQPKTTLVMRGFLFAFSHSRVWQAGEKSQVWPYLWGNGTFVVKPRRKLLRRLGDKTWCGEKEAGAYGTPAASTAPTKRGRAKRKVSPEALERMREGQRRRWAAVRGESPAPAETSKPNRKLSAAGRKAIVAALKKRWAAKRASDA